MTATDNFGAAASVLLLFMFAGLIFYGIHLLVRERAVVEEEQGV